MEFIRQYLVLATGDAAYASKIQDFQVDLTVTVKGATVEGNFNRNEAGIWLDYNLAPQGYGYLMPFSEKEATITFGIPDYQENQDKDLNRSWDDFYKRVCRDFRQSLRITDRFEVTRYMIGQCRKPRLGNTFFVGNCFGAIMPTFGFGQLPSLLTGIYAAHDLAGQGDYTHLVKPLQDSYKNSLVIRRLLEQLDNPKLDVLVGLFNTELAGRLFNNERLDPFKTVSFLLRPQVKIKTGMQMVRRNNESVGKTGPIQK